MTLLILAGTAEARDLAKYCAATKIPAQASLSGATRKPLPLAVPTRHGGFGGADGFKTFIKEQNISAILDATHPFASFITERTFQVSQELGLPMMRYDRPEWKPSEGDKWTFINDESEAINYISSHLNVFLATGRQSLLKFKNISNSRLYCRQIDPPDMPFPWLNGTFVIGRPPFSEAAEKALFLKLNIDVLIVKNSGGSASRTKLDAARSLEMPVLMINRPTPTPASTLRSLTEIKIWLDNLNN
tara:strand:- start:8868 stop:9602 length:735 start_codon:yes stop_codon:yes gene_type:complete